MIEDNESITINEISEHEQNLTNENNSINLSSNNLNRNIFKKSNISNIIYGNDYNIKKPKKLGNSYVFCYIKNWPLITIGPNCIIYKINLI